MATPRYQRISDGLYCIDALYTAPGVACCYLLGSAGDYALIETGTARSLANILATLERLGIERKALRFIIPTHVHLDHAGAAGQLMAMLPEATLLIHPRGARHMIDPSRLIDSAISVYGEDDFRSLYGEVLAVPAERVRSLKDGETIYLGRRVLSVKHTRGHAEHHFCLFDEHSRGWFSGDMFGISYPRLRFGERAFVMPATTPTQFDPQAYIASVDALTDAEPQQFYLTHYGALAFKPEQAICLKQQLQAYAALAGHRDRSVAGLREAVRDITAELLADFVDTEQAARIADTLDMDAQLNAQGIAWWIEHPRIEGGKNHVSQRQ